MDAADEVVHPQIQRSDSALPGTPGVDPQGLIVSFGC